MGSFRVYWPFHIATACDGSRSAMTLFTATNMICRRGVTSLRQAIRFFASIRILAFESGGLCMSEYTVSDLRRTCLRELRSDNLATIGMGFHQVQSRQMLEPIFLGCVH